MILRQKNILRQKKQKNQTCNLLANCNLSILMSIAIFAQVTNEGGNMYALQNKWLFLLSKSNISSINIQILTKIWQKFKFLALSPGISVGFWLAVIYFRVDTVIIVTESLVLITLQYITTVC